MSEVLYTTTEAIRATLGVDEFDIQESMMVGMNLEFVLRNRLCSILPTHDAVYNATEEGEIRLTLWCQYYGAWWILTKAPLSIPIKHQANTDSLTRFPLDLKTLASSLWAEVAKLEGLLAPAVFPSTPLTLAGISTPDYDPVSGEGL